jgi:hypothetical protein
MNYTDRIDRVFAHGANPQYNTSQPGLKDPIINSEDGYLDSSTSDNGTTFSVNGLGLGNQKRDNDNDNGIVGSPGAPYTCEHLSPLPGRCDQMRGGVADMWASEPAWGPDAFAKIKCPVWIVDGDHE